jgi:hypothetical protein
MASKDTQRRLIKENNSRPTVPNAVRRTVSNRSPSFDQKCPMQIIIFLGQDDRFYLSTKSCLNHRHHPALKADAILHGQNEMEQGDLNLLFLAGGVVALFATPLAERLVGVGALSSAAASVASA